MCETCAPGYANSNTSATSCRACQPGQYTAAQGVFNCQVCPPATYSAMVAATGCELCQAGEYVSGHGITACQTCHPGTFAANIGQSACQPCGAGTYTANTGRSICQACDAGTFMASTGASGCVKCAAGRYSSSLAALDPGACLLCQAGTFSTAEGLVSLLGCISCGEGATSPAGAVSCIGCPPNTFPDPSNGGCVSCPANSVVQPENTTSGLDSCICDIGHYHAYNAKARGGMESYSEDEAGVLYKNHVFTTGIGALTVLKPVALITTCNGELTQEEPALYEPGTYPVSAAVDVMGGCALPYVISYTVDERFNASETTAYFRCKPCPPGAFSDLVGVDMCNACPTGMYQDETGSNDCKTCPPGTASLVDGSTRCNACSPGEYQLQDLNACVLCPAGKFSGLEGRTACADCEGHTWSDAGASACNDCPYWSTGGGPGVMACKCQDGTYLDLSVPENPFCRICGTGMFAPSQSNVCLPCRSGWFNDRTAQVACESCPLNASAGVHATACVSCAIGETRSADASECVVCPAGSICLPDGRRTVCSPGMYAATGGLYSLDQCSVCPSNMVCLDGSNAEPCPTNTHSSPGATSMLSCVCDTGYECTYVRSTRVKVLLPYTVEQFEAMRLDFIRAVAEAAGVGFDRVKIMYVRDMSGQPTRRSLWSLRAKRTVGEGNNGALLVRAQVEGKFVGMRRLDSILFKRGMHGTMEELPTREKRGHRVVVRKRPD